MDEKNDILAIKEKKTLHEIHKEDFSDYLFENTDKIIYLYTLNNKFINYERQNTLAVLLQEKVSKTLSLLDIKNSQVDKLIVLPNGQLKIIVNQNGEEETLTFNLNQDISELDKNPDINIYLGNKEKLKKEKKEKLKNATKLVSQAENLLEAMDYIFSKNEEEIFDELDKDDKLDTHIYGNDLFGKDLVYIQNELKPKIEKINSIPSEYFNQKEIRKITNLQLKYLKMFMGIGDKYEGGAQLLKDSQSSFDKITDNIINFSGDNNQLLDRLKELHQEIDDNDYQSTTVERSYKITMDTLHDKIFKKLLNSEDKNKDKNLIYFAKIITGKEYNGESIDIDDNLRNPELAQEAILAVMQRDGGVIDQLNNKGSNNNINDIEVKDKNPKSIIDNIRNNFYKRYGKENKSQMLFNSNLKTAGYEDVLNIGENETYENLSFYQKTKLSVLYRVSKKMETGKDILDIGIESGSKLISLENPIVKQQYILSDFAGLFNGVAKDYIEELADNLDDSFNENETIGEWFTGKDSKDVNLKKGSIEAEAFDLFQDINGAGLFDLSDINIARAKTTGKFVGVIAISMAVPYLIIPAITGSAMGTIPAMVLAGRMSSVSGRIINPHGYDTKEEAGVDLITDIYLGGKTGELGGIFAKKFEKEGTKFFSKQILKNSKTIAALDLTFLGLVPEVLRMKAIDKIYHNQDILEKD